MKLKKLIEGIQNIGGVLKFNWAQDSPNDIIPLKLKKYHKKFSFRKGKEIYVGYKYLTKDKESLDLFRSALKSNSLSEHDENLLINKAVENFIQVNEYPIDVIITPKSSSRFLNKLAKQLYMKYPGSTLATDTITKRTYDEFLIVGVEFDKIPTEYKKEILPILQKASASGEFKMKLVPVQFRRTITNFLKFQNNQHQNLIKKITGGTVLIIDDIYTGGSTFQEMFSIIDSMAAKNSIGFALISAQ